jgi:hypothetical protein
VECAYVIGRVRVTGLGDVVAVGFYGKVQYQDSNPVYIEGRLGKNITLA